MARCRSTVNVERPIHLISNLDCRLVHSRFSIHEFTLLQYMSGLQTTLEEMQPQRLGRNYALYWTGSPAVATGLWVQRLTVAWLAWKMTLGILAGPYCDGGPFTEYRAWSGRGYFGGSVKPQTPHATLLNEQCGTGTHLGELHFGWAYRSIWASLFRRS